MMDMEIKSKPTDIRILDSEGSGNNNHIPLATTVTNIMENSNFKTSLRGMSKVASNPPQQNLVNFPRRYRLIHKSPVKTSPNKNLIYMIQKCKRRKKKKLSPGKLQFILPKVSFISTTRKQKQLRSKPMPNPITINLNGNQSVPLSSSANFNSDSPSTSAYESTLLNSNYQNFSLDKEIGEAAELPSKSDEELYTFEENDDNDPVDNEDQCQFQEHLSAFLKASSTIADERRFNANGFCETRIERKRRRISDKIKALSYVPDLDSQQDALVADYLREVKTALDKEGETKFDEFISMLSGLANNGVTFDEIYFKIMEILSSNPILKDDFTMFLSHEQALRLGKYSKYLTLNRMRQFIEELKFHFSSQPPHMLRVIRILQSISQPPDDVNPDDLFGLLMRLLKRQPWLLESLSFCIPTATPQYRLDDIGHSDDFEDINFTGSTNPEADEFEHITLPDDDDSKTAKACPEACGCGCHSLPNSDDVSFDAFFNRNDKWEKCVSCGLKFIDGRVYIQCGRVLRLLKISINDAFSETGVVAKEEGCSLVEDSNESADLHSGATDGKFLKGGQTKAISKPSSIDPESDRPKKVNRKAKKL